MIENLFINFGIAVTGGAILGLVSSLVYSVFRQEDELVSKKKPIRIAFGCQKRVGKDTAAEFFESQLGATRLSFAEPLYDILEFACERLGFDYKKDRKFLQWVGTEWARDKDPDVFVNLLIATVQKCYPTQDVIVSDVRMKNEFRKLKENGFTMVRIIRDKDEVDEHASENDLLYCDEWDYIINNNGSLEEFYKSLTAMYNDIVT